MSNATAIPATCTNAVATYSINGETRTIEDHPSNIYVQLDLLCDIYPSFRFLGAKEANKPTVIDDDFQVCDDCVLLNAGGDEMSLEGLYDDDTSPTLEERANEIWLGMEEAGGAIVLGDDRNEFSIEPCGCCGTRYHGARTKSVVITES
jgi:hypothetical protein